MFGRMSFLEFLIMLLVACMIVITIAVGHIATWW
jgi:hypothetical protein